MFRMIKTKILLIEPVWNRNSLCACADQNDSTTFNRTSLESKHRENQSIRKRRELLIEPVWNRNAATVLPMRWISAFNRTSLESKLCVSFESNKDPSAFNRTSLESKLNIHLKPKCCVYLLIEPVWNRNYGSSLKSMRWKSTFNRTSLESKQARKRKCKEIQRCSF